MDPQSVCYRKVMLKVGKSLNREQIDDFKFFCNGIEGFTQYDRDEIADGIALVSKLEELDVVSKHSVEFVATILKHVNRNDLELELRRYEADYIKPRHPGQESGVVSQPMSALNVSGNDGDHSGLNIQNRPAVWGEDLTLEFDTVVENIGRDWRQLARRLGLSEVDIQCITEDNIRNLREQSRRALYLWKERKTRNATKASLVRALRSCRMNYIADILEGYINN